MRKENKKEKQKQYKGWKGVGGVSKGKLAQRKRHHAFDNNH